MRLTVEPVRFGTGLPIFGDQVGAADPLAVFTERGYALRERARLNAAGTLLLTLLPDRSAV